MAARALLVGGVRRQLKSTTKLASFVLLLQVAASFAAPESAHAQCAPAGPFNNAPDTVICSPGMNDNIDTSGGDDQVTIDSGNVASIIEGTGRDDLIMNGGTLGTADQGSGGDSAIVNGATITGVLDQGTGRDSYSQTGGNVDTVIQGGSGDSAIISTGAVLRILQQGSGNDGLTITDATITTVDQGSFNDLLTLNSGTIGSVDTGTGRDDSAVNGGTVNGTFQQGSGTDYFIMSAGQLGALDQGPDFDTAVITGGRIIGQFVDGDDVTFSGGRIGSVNLVVADNIFRMSGTAQIDTFLNAEQGNDTFLLTGGTIGTSINTGSGNDMLLLDGTTVGSFIDFETGNDTITLNSGSIGGDVLMGQGSDEATIATTFDPTAGLGGTLDGGDDVSNADGDIDTLTFDSWSGSTPGGDLVNWENVIIDGGTVNFSDGMLTTGQDADAITGLPQTGLTVTGGGQLNLGGMFTLTGNATLENGASILAATPGGVGSFMINGQFDNRGELNFSGGSPAAGDRLTVTGDYYGGGTIRFDSALDASEASDLLIIGGQVRAPGTIVTVNDVGSGLGAPTGSGPGNGIKIVDVSNTDATSNGDFVLNGELETGGISGAFVYNLFLGSDGNWYLQSVYVPDPEVVTPPGPGGGGAPQPNRVALFAPTVPTYEVYPQILLGLNGLPTFHQRVGTRYAAGSINSDSTCLNAARDEYGQYDEYNDRCTPHERLTRSAWATITASHLHSDQARSTTLADFDTDQWKLEGGSDVMFGEVAGLGNLVAGITVHYGQASSDVDSPFGNGKIDAAAGGIGLTGTILSNSGGYLDAQGRFSWSSADLSSDAIGKIAEDNRGLGYALGLEAGRRMSLSNQLSLTPQAQLVFKSVDFDTFTDRFNGRVSLLDGKSLEGRLGILIEKDSHWLSQDGSRSHQTWFVVGNLLYEFLDGSEVGVSGIKFDSRSQRFWGELGIGGTLSWADDAYSLTGEIRGQTSLEDFADSYGVAGKADFRIRF